MKPVRGREIDRLLDRQARLWERDTPSTPAAVSTPRANLAFSQRPASGARELADQVATHLGWQIYDREILDALHENDELGKSVLESLDEHLLSYREDWLYHLFVPDHMSSPGYIHRLSQLLFSLAMRGRGVFVGRGASFVIPHEHRLAVLVVRSFDTRLERWHQLNPAWSASEARRSLGRLDRVRGEFVWKCFHRIVDDPLGYDLCVNLDRLDIETAARVIVSALQQRFPQEFAGQAPAPAHS